MDTRHAARQAFPEPQGRESVERLRPRVSRGGYGLDYIKFDVDYLWNSLQNLSRHTQDDAERRLVLEEFVMRGRSNSNFYLEERFRHRDASDVAAQLASLRKKSGLPQKELAKRVGTSQQQISRLESPSYRGHSLSMLRRVADVLAASVHVEIRGKRQEPPPVVAEAIVDYRAKAGIRQNGLQKFELDFLKKERADIARNLRIAEALYKEAVSLGTIPLKDPLDGIEVDLKIARVVNSV